MNRRVKIVLVLVLLLGVGVWFSIHGTGGSRRAVEAYKRDLLAKGEKLIMVELASPTTNDPEQVKQFMDLMSSRIPTNLPLAMRIIVPGAAARSVALLMPDQMSGYEQNVRRVSRLSEILKANRLSFHVDFSQGPSYSMPHLAKLKAADQLAVGAFLQALTTNDNQEAWAGLSVAAGLAQSSDDGHTLISDLVSIAMVNIASAAVWEALQSDGWSGDQLAELQKKWEELNLIENLGPALRMERAEEIAYLAKFRRTNELDSLAILNIGGSPTSSGGGGLMDDLRDKAKELYDRYPGYWRWRATWSYDEELVLLQMFDADLVLADSVGKGNAFVPALKSRERRIADILKAHSAGRKHFRFFGDDTLRTYLFKVAEVETFRRLIVAAIAIKRFQLAHGVSPGDLNSLVPAYLPQVPVDFMDGKPLRYKPNPDGSFILYSVGEDGEDNGGDPTPPTRTSGISTWLKGRDIVWPRVATQKEIEDYLKAQKQKSGAGTE